MTKYKRIILTGTLTTQSNFHIGTGDEEVEKDDNGEIVGTYNAICLDVNNKPYIPASSLRGYLRSIVETNYDERTANKLFGMARQQKDEDETGNIGLIRVYDATWSPSQTNYQQKLHSQTSIDALTNTAKKHQLATHAIVPPNSIFNLSLELDNVTHEHLTIFLKSLDTLNKEYGGKLGKAKTSGQGEIKWEQLHLKVLTKEQFLKWLDLNHDKTLDDFYQSPLDISEINTLIMDKKNPFENTESKTLEVSLKANSPILINNPSATKIENKERKKCDEIDHIFMQQGGKAIIPGSTLKGWVRARCRKILLTLINKNGSIKDDDLENLVNKIFGSTEQQGLIEFNKLEVIIKESDIHRQTFNAIDRFTGGVKEGALYNAEAIWPTETFNGSIRYRHDTDKLKGWMKLLLLFVIRDAMEGDLVLGWGKSKGFGRLRLSNNDHKDWQSLYKKLPKNLLKKWQDDLNQLIQETQGEIA